MIIWLTGGSGSGKSAVAAFFGAAGYRCVDADRIAKAVREPGGAAYDAIVNAFGKAFLRKDKTIDNRLLGEAVFRDPEKLALLNQITHGPIVREMEKAGMGAKNVVYDAPLPNTFGIPCDKTLYVTAPPEVRIARIMTRDGISRETAQARIDAQKPHDVYAKGADAVLVNDGDLALLKEKAEPYIKEWFSSL